MSKIVHTGELAQGMPGNYLCLSCDRLITMHGNYKDHFPLCPYEKKGVYYRLTNLSEFLNENTQKEES